MLGGRISLPPALRYGDFRLFISGAVLSYLGTQFTTVAMAWQIYQLTNSALDIGLLGLARAVPQIALSLFGGAIADGWNRKRVLMVLQIANCSVSTSLAVLSFTGLMSAHFLLAAQALFALWTSVESPTRSAVVPNLVERPDIRAAVAMHSSQRQLTHILGPSLAGVALAFAGPGLCYTLDAASWFAMFVALALIRRPMQSGGRAGFSFGEMLAGARFVWSQQVILAFMFIDFGALFFGSAVALLPIYARDILSVGPIGLGILYAASSVGAFAAAAVMSTQIQVENVGRWVLFGFALFSVCTMGFALSRLLWLSALMLAGTGFGDQLGAVLRNSTNVILTPDQLRGRVSAVNSAFVQGGPQLGQFESGVVASMGGAPLSALTGGIGALVLVALIALMPKVREFRLSGAAEDPAPSTPTPVAAS